MGLEHIAESIHAINRGRVEAATFGHLAPKPSNKYEGTILFAHGEYGDLVPLRTDFKDLLDSPWLFSDLNDWISEQETIEGQIYFFRGTYTKFKTGNFRFSGKVRALHVNP